MEINGINLARSKGFQSQGFTEGQSVILVDLFNLFEAAHNAGLMFTGPVDTKEGLWVERNDGPDGVITQLTSHCLPAGYGIEI